MMKNTILDHYVSEKLNKASLPGNETLFEPDEADAVGAFFEDALSLEDAKASMLDEEAR